MIARFLILVLASGAAAAQQTAATQNASISGVVKDKITGKPLANYAVSTYTNSTWVGDTIFQSAATRQVQSTTDSSGRYRLSDLAPGLYRIDAQNAERFGPGLERRVMLAGHDLDNIDFAMVLDGSIKGKVVDENQEPVPGMTVWLIGREYYLGSVGYFFRGQATTDDLGEFTLTYVPPGRPFLILAEMPLRVSLAHSEVPLDPRLRKRVPMRTWYPNSPARGTAEVLTLRPGEDREGVDIEVRKAPSYCLEGTAEGPSSPGEVSLGIEPLQPSMGVSHGMSTIGRPRGPMTAADGKFRICDLTPGNYRLSASQGSFSSNSQQSPNFGTAVVMVVDQDQRGFHAIASPPLTLEGEVAWAGEPPATPNTARVTVSLGPVYRGNLPLERPVGRQDIPSTFTFTGLFQDDYSVRAIVTAPGLYVKDVTYSGRSILHEPVRIGSAPGGAGLRVIVGHDGGTISAQVRDKDGNPVGNIGVLMMPADVGSEAMLAEVLVRGVTDQQGIYTSYTLASGKYYVVATEDTVDYTPEQIGKLWRARNRFQEVDLAPSGSAQTTLEPVRIE